MAAAAEAGVVATNTPGAMSEAVADFAFGMMLCIARRLHEGDALMRSGGWNELPGSSVYGKTLGLVGAGRIGGGVAERAKGFRMRVLVCDPVMADNAADRNRVYGSGHTAAGKRLRVRTCSRDTDDSRDV